jgi:hypothetical protein
LSLELGVVDVSKVVGSWSVVLQGHSKERRVQLGLDGVKESSLRAGTDCINSSQWAEVEAGNLDRNSPVLMELNARPSRPSLSLSCTN